MMNSPGYSEEGRGYHSQYISRALSPRMSGYRPGPRLMDSNLSPYPFSRESEQINITEFINLIQTQLKRINPTFAFQFTADPPLAQAVNFLTQAVDRLLTEQGKDPKITSDQYEEDINYSSNRRLRDELEKAKETTKNLTRYEHLLKKKEEKLEEEKFYSSNRRLRDELEKAKETTKNLTRYEHLLKKKEEKLEEEKSKVRAEKKGIKDMEEHSKVRAEKKGIKDMEEQLRQALNDLEIQKKNWNDSKRFEQERIRLDKEDADRKLSEAKEMKEKIEKKLDESTKHLKYEKESLMQLENCLNQTKQTLSIDQKRITQDKLEIEKEKWKLDQRSRKLEEQEILLNVKIEHLDQEKQTQESEKTKLLNIRKDIDDERNELLQIKDQIASFERESKISARKSPIEDQGISDRGYTSVNQEYDAKFIELEEREKEIEQAYRELQEQMDNFNRELEEREIVLDEREFSVEKQEKDIKKKLDNFSVIEASLIESKIQVEDLRTFTIPELEKQSETLSNLLQELTERKQDMENLIENLHNEISLVGKQKGMLDVIEEDKSQVSADSYQMTHSPNRDIDEITIELEQKIDKVKEREIELEHAHKEIENDREELTKAAEFLKQAHVEMEEKRKQIDKDLAEEKAKLKNQFLKLESGMRLLSTKEAEVFSFKRKLDEKNQMLIIKEKELMARMRKTDSHGSSIVEEREGESY
ncbi:hypothetical protein SteCoe_9205 [Stentor coeruleus]|uniref:Uncharacterized protein n=1 Tax=Stentor coeruleus TaxID=5963 RepID=A0A1R2CIH1_9CILI|nr:hypothetical protein SteCoe_9205 [Stentor coeruleus]